MRSALTFSLLGAVLVFVGLGAFNPIFAAFFDGAVVPLFELESAELLVEGGDLPLLQVLLLFAGVAAAGAAAGFAARVGRRVAVNLLLFAVAVLGVTFYVHLNGPALVTAAAGGSLRPDEIVSPVEGVLFLYAGGLSILLGGLAVLVAIPAERRKDPVVRAALRRPIGGLPWDLFATTATSAVLQVGFLLTALFLWQEQPVRAMRAHGQPPLRVSAVVKTPTPPEEPLLDTVVEDRAAAKRPGGAEGTFGDPDIDPAIESRIPKRDGEHVAQIDPRRVGLNDLLATSRLGGRNAISGILAPDAPGFQNRLAVAMAGAGSEFQLGHGTRGLSFRGTETGGGGTGTYGRIHGLGPLDTGGDDRGVRARKGDKRERRVGTVDVGKGGTGGFCSRGDIEKNVRLRAGAVRACYEQQLQVRPKLAGKITVRWTIHVDGTVKNAAVASSSLRNDAVERCILRAIRRIRFQKPKGGLCVVSWPFAFQPG